MTRRPCQLLEPCAGKLARTVLRGAGRSNALRQPDYLGHEPGGKDRKPGIPTEKNPRTGPYRKMIADGRDLHELHALMAPRPFLVSGGSEDFPERWKALNHAVAVNQLLGYEARVAMTNRKGHSPTPESNEQMMLFFAHFLKHGRAAEKGTR